MKNSIACSSQLLPFLKARSRHKTNILPFVETLFICLGTLFERKERIDDDQFVDSNTVSYCFVKESKWTLNSLLRNRVTRAIRIIFRNDIYNRILILIF